MRILLVFQSSQISVTEWPRQTPNSGLSCRKVWKFAILVRLGGNEEFRELREPSWPKILAKCSRWLFEKCLAGRRALVREFCAGVTPLLFVLEVFLWTSGGVAGCPGCRHGCRQRRSIIDGGRSVV